MRLGVFFAENPQNQPRLIATLTEDSLTNILLAFVGLLVKSLLLRPPSVCLFEVTVLLTYWSKTIEYSDATFNGLDTLATDVIIGEKIFKEHESVTFTFEGHRLPCTTLTLSVPRKP